MKDDPLVQILAWSLKQPDWQRDALRRLFTGGALSATDLDELLAICKAKHGLCEPRLVMPLSKEHLAISGGDAYPVTLSKLTHHRGVNALAPEQAVSFGPHLTIIYGQNAAGKSGYSRILRRACRARFSETVLGNVLSGETPLQANATIEFRVGTEADKAEWTPDAPAIGPLAAVSVFDSQCAPVYLESKTNVAFRPFSLDLLDKLSAACAEMRKRLEKEKDELVRLAVALPTVEAGTSVAGVLAGLTALTRPDDVQRLATLSADEERRLQLLRDRRRDREVSNPRKQAQELDLKASRVERLRQQLERVTAALGTAALETARQQRLALIAAKAALESLRKTVLTADLLQGTGQETWRKMWDAAATYSGNAYPGVAFPVVADGAKCLLCQQPIGADAAIRFTHFRELVESTAQADVRRTEATWDALANTFRGLTVNSDEMSLVVDELESHDQPLAALVRDQLRAAASLRDELLASVANEQPLPAVGVDPSAAMGLVAAVADLRARATMLRKETPSTELADQSELRELEARSTLRGSVADVIQEIERKKRIAAYGQCVDDTGTNSLTRQSTELTKLLITVKLQEQFKSELKRLRFTHLALEIKAAGGERGVLYHQLAFANAPGVPVARVLSEGESRTLSLAAFLTELSTSAAASAIIFDDPVSSLDHVWRERIAGRLVDEAKDRQVIVFTHDLVFLGLLIGEADSRGVSIQHQYIRSDSTGVGMCSPELPWVAMALKDRLGKLRALWQAAEKVHRTEGTDAWEKDGRHIYGLLREAWERAIEEVLLNDVILRYRPSIETKRLRSLHDITAEDCGAVENGMSECSRWLRGHDQAAADGSPFPGPEELKSQIDALEAWSKAVKKRRSGGS